MLVVGRPGVDGRGGALCHRREVRASRPPVIALVGDGAMQMNNMAELITVAKYWREWSNPKWVVCVFNNQDLNQVTWEQRVQEGDPKFNASQQLPDVPYHRFAELIGLKGIFVDNPDRLGAAWDEALAADRAGGAGGKDRPGCAAAAAAHHAEASEELHQRSAEPDPDESGVIVGSAQASPGVCHARPQGLDRCRPSATARRSAT